MKKLFTKSGDFTSEYCCTIVRIGEIRPIENADFLVQTTINGENAVIGKSQIKEGDILFYSSNETQLNSDFLRVNNLYSIDCRDLNDNYEEVEKLYQEGKKEEIKERRIVGYFDKRGRVQMKRFRGTPSMGYLFSLNEMSKYCPKAKDVNLEELVGEDFDTVDGELFVKAYIPYVPPRQESIGRKNERKRMNRLKRFDRLVKGEFVLHYDTDPLPKFLEDGGLKPTDEVTISPKFHGTSSIFSNVLVKRPLKLSLLKRWFNLFVDVTGLLKTHRITDYEIVYGNVYSSRKNIKNKEIIKGNPINYYETDIWGEFNNLIKDYIPEGMTVYGEICGYTKGKDGYTYIQKDYDYGCKEGESFLMPYRITTTNEDRSKKEWSVRDVTKWTEELLTTHPELEGRIKVIPILYEGTLADLYPELDVSTHWNENVLTALRNDTKMLGLEKNEPLCRNKVVREGIVLRIENDTEPRAFKLKSLKFLEREGKLIDKGEVDMEMLEGLNNEQ